MGDYEEIWILDADHCIVQYHSILGMDLGVTTLLGWFVLASLLVNEARSICENLVEMGVNVPTILVKGLQAANRVVNQEDTEDESE